AVGAGAALAVAAAAAAVLLVRRQPVVPLPSAPVASAQSPSASVPGEAEYQTALASLEVELAQRRPEMPERVRAAVDETLRIVDEAIAASRAALLARPGDPELTTLLDNAYEDKLDLLREATELVTGI